MHKQQIEYNLTHDNFTECKIKYRTIKKEYQEIWNTKTQKYFMYYVFQIHHYIFSCSKWNIIYCILNTVDHTLNIWYFLYCILNLVNYMLNFEK